MSSSPLQDMLPELPEFDMRIPVSEKLFRRAKTLIPGGVNSPVRAFNGVGGTPVFVAAAEGAIFQDMDEHQYVDFVGSWGPMLLGHANPQVVEAIKHVVELGTSFGAPTDRETYLADLIVTKHKNWGVEMVRLVNSGTEATMSAIRLARGYTGKKRIIKFDGCYHGHGDSLLVAAGSGAATAGIPGSAGVPEELAALTTIVPFNDLAAVKEVFENFDDVACIITEPVAGNMGLVAPKDGFLQGLRELCTKHGALLIFDEVMTGFRVHKHSAMGLYNIKPDLACFGKIVGGGMPLAVYGGRKEIMEHLAPLGAVYQAGTLSGNPVAVAAGCAMLEQLDDSVYQKVKATTEQLTEELTKLAKKHNQTMVCHHVGGMFGLFFSDKLPQNFTEVKATDTAKFSRFFHGMLEEGVYLPPSAFEAWFTSTAHEQLHMDLTFKAADKVLSRV